MKPLRVNGIVIPLALFVPAIMGLSWLIGLSDQVNANDTEIQKQANTAERLARIEVTLENNKEKIDDIKVAQKEQSKKLDRILEKLSD